MLEKAKVQDTTTVLDQSVVRVDGPNEKDLVLKRFQEIPDWFIDKLKNETTVQKATPGKEMRRVASIPVTIVEKWQREGFDINKESAKAIVARLASEDLGYFITGTP